VRSQFEFNWPIDIEAIRLGNFIHAPGRKENVMITLKIQLQKKDIYFSMNSSQTDIWNVTLV